MQDISHLTETEGISRHYPQLPELCSALYDVMRAVELSDLNKLLLYKHFLKCADFAANFLNSEAYFELAKRLDDHGELCVEKSLEATTANHSFLARAEIVRCCSNFIIKKFRETSEAVLVQILTKQFETAPLNRVVLPKAPQRIPQHAVFFAVEQLDVTLTFVLLLVLAFPLGLTLEAFDQYEDVDFAEFTLKELVFNAQAAPDTVTFWFPAFSLDDKAVMQARFIEILANCDIASTDEEMRQTIDFALNEEAKEPINRGIGSNQSSTGTISPVEMRLMIAEEVSSQMEPIKQEEKRLIERVEEIENENGILAASQEKILLDFDKMFQVVKELSQTISFLGRRKNSSE